MILTRKLLDTKYIWWFHGKRIVEQAKQEILECKQSSKIQRFSPENAEFFGVNFLL